jgi:hypothetical protein
MSEHVFFISAYLPHYVDFCILCAGSIEYTAQFVLGSKVLEGFFSK